MTTGDHIAHSPPGHPAQTHPERGGDRREARVALLAELDACLTHGSGELAALHRHAVLPAGKLLRPLLVVDAALATGGPVHPVLPAAVAMELLHVGSLIHDDIIDGDIERRGRDSVHHRFGTHRAILGGDALFFRPFALVTQCRERGVPDERVVRAGRALAEAGEELCRGAMLELDQAGVPELSLEAYLRMAGLKTSPLFSGACRIGAILSGADRGEVAALDRYGHALGIAFQARDDLLPYDTEPPASGKPADSDLGNRRPTLPVILAHQRAAPDDRTLIEKLLADGARGADAQARMAEVVRRTGAPEAAREVLDEHVRRCHRALTVFDPGPGVAEMAAMANRLRRQASRPAGSVLR
ncbi:polyprenyl synthetase family protein [Streptomyces sp. V4-01]|uniref:Polyprenyl synthetase family protein n=1 Tax=Actinacidiphila polyblastidii TaxID=3110430 RepID=A0ABU7PHR0_9ACTN|nr:polyprenyl synthetase family protein [Streptomyces sp. V4-01]